ncbi:uncharacterized protein LOC135631168 isoform X2 [Musa acuminata AAA Group]|uniref:uncharacterized protein LOC135631168 isoform X2 n=1 Tax=Musa acuminata AAA Group TaxID=214697 RepID=UPI0031DFEA8A
MANLFCKQAQNYVETRPSYPEDLFRFIASKTPQHDLAWDVGTGSGQAAVSLARLYKRLVATDTSQEQLSFAPRLPNIDYRHTPPTLSPTDLHQHVAPPSTVDLVCVAQALHWLDLPTFYDGVNSVLAKPGGVLAVWCYTEPRVDPAVDTVFWRLYTESGRFWAAARQMVDDEYRSLLFPYDPVDGEESTGPFEFAAERAMDMGTYLTYIRSWSAYQTAKERGVELLTDGMVSDLEKAWGGDGKAVKVVRFPIFLRIGKVRT